MKEFNLKNGVALPPMNGATMEARLSDAREAYGAAITEALDTETEKFILPGDKIALIDDALGFVAFLLTLKATEAYRQEPTQQNLIHTWGKLYMGLARSVPESLLGYARAVKNPQPAGE